MVQILVDWGDGTVESVPAVGTSQSWTLTGKQHDYLPGDYVVVVTDPVGNSDATPVRVLEPDVGPPSQRTWLSGSSGTDLGAWRGNPREIAGCWMNDPACYPLVPPDAGCPECGELADWTGPIDAGLSPPDFSTWAAEAGGAHDAFWTSFAANLAAARGARPTWVRPYYEFNGDWMDWSVPAGQEANFRTAFDRTAAILRAGYPGVKIMLGTAASDRADIAACWPTTTLDALSVDFYNTFPWVNTQAAFDDKITTAEGPSSLEMQRLLARSKGIPVVISEWASASADANGSGGGDAPGFFIAMHDWLTDHAGTGPGQVLAEVYFNIDEGYPNNYFLTDSAGVVNPAQPNAAAAYKSLWSPSGQEMPAEAPPGWVRVFSDDFDTDQPRGTWPGAYDDTWYGYDCTAWGDDDGCDTSGLGDYSRSEVVSASGGMMHYYFHTGTDGLPKCAAEGPKIDGVENGMTYGRYAVRWRVDNLPRYGSAFLLWPAASPGHPGGNWDEGEVDYPEGPYDGNIQAFNHCVGNPSANCAAYDPGVAMASGWHTSVIEWKPGSIEFFLDGASIGKTTTSIPTTPLRWVLQTGVTLDAILPDPATKGLLDVDWVTIDRLL